MEELRGKEVVRKVREAPFVQIPLNVTEDRLVGTVDLEESMKVRGSCHKSSDQYPPKTAASEFSRVFTPCVLVAQILNPVQCVNLIHNPNSLHSLNSVQSLHSATIYTCDARAHHDRMHHGASCHCVHVRHSHVWRYSWWQQERYPLTGATPMEE